METYILKKSEKKGKRFVIIMDKMKHHFGSDVGKTYIDGRTEKEKQNWIKRHSVNKNWDNKHSSIFFSRMLLWTEPTLKKAIKALEKKDKVKIKVEL
tara:strand:- start:185 stop:475 length:291 start_codon:yes stop_codon:yes gene_type:complete